MGHDPLSRVPRGAWKAVEQGREFPFSVKSNFARDYATGVAAAASLGWLTTRNPRTGEFDRIWRPTSTGLIALEHHKPSPPQPEAP